MRSLALWLFGSIAGGACVPVVVGLVRGGAFGALLAGWLSMGFGFAAGACRPRTATALVALWTCTVAAINWWGSGEAKTFWIIWGVLGACSAVAMVGGMILGWAARRSNREKAAASAAAAEIARTSSLPVEDAG